MRAFVPIISKLPDRKVISVTSVGDPNIVMEPYMKALYGAVYFARCQKHEDNN